MVDKFLILLIFVIVNLFGCSHWSGRYSDLQIYRASESVPLLEAVAASVPTVEVFLNDLGPLLFVVDISQKGALVTRDALNRIGQAPRWQLRGGLGFDAQKVSMGELSFGSVKFDVVQDAELGQIAARSIDGVLGDVLFELAPALRLDAYSGALSFVQSETPPENAIFLAGEDRLASVKLEGKNYKFFATTGLARTSVRTSIADELELEKRASDWLGVLSFAGQPATLRSFFPFDDKNDGALGFDALSKFSIFATKSAVYLFEKTSGMPLERFGELPIFATTPAAGEPGEDPADLPQNCGEHFEHCLQGEVESFVDGEVTLRFERPRVVLDKAYWLRVAFGKDVSVLVSLHPKRLARKLQIEMQDPRFIHIFEPGTPVRVVDIVPLRQPCSGDLCVRGLVFSTLPEAKTAPANTFTNTKEKP